MPDNNDMAFERTILAYDRTLLAWVRTAISLITFGFTLYKFLGDASATENTAKRFLSPRIIGMIMISFGLLALFLALLQQRAAMKKIKKNYPDVPGSYSLIICFLVMVFGLMLFLGALFRQ